MGVRPSLNYSRTNVDEARHTPSVCENFRASNFIPSPAWLAAPLSVKFQYPDSLSEVEWPAGRFRSTRPARSKHIVHMRSQRSKASEHDQLGIAKVEAFQS